MSVRLLMADDHDLFVAGVRSLLERRPDIEVVGEVSDGLAAVQAAELLDPDVVMIDVTMPRMNGIEATRRMRGHAPNLKVLCLSMHHDRQHITAALEAGASGYVTKDSALTELLEAIKHVLQDRIYLSPSITKTVIEGYRTASERIDSSPFNLLTDREREVLQLIAEGHTTNEIAELLGVSAKTVFTHREHLMKKLKLDGVAKLTRYAIMEGLTAVELKVD